VHNVAKYEKLTAFAETTSLEGSSRPSHVDKGSVATSPSTAGKKEVLGWLEKAQRRANRPGPTTRRGPGWTFIAWAIAIASSYDACPLAASEAARVEPTLWGYAVHHNDAPRIRELLLHQDGFLDHA
jgi:hypothetical protein